MLLLLLFMCIWFAAGSVLCELAYSQEQKAPTLTSTFESDHTSWHIMNQVSRSLKDDTFKGELGLDHVQKEELSLILSETLQEESKILTESLGLDLGLSDLNKDNQSGVHELQEHLGLEREIRNKIGREVLREVVALLLPHQITRLKQIVLRKQLMSLAGGDFIKMYSLLSQRLNLAPRDQKQFLDSIDRTSQSYQRDVQTMNKKFIAEAMKLLSVENKKRLEELIGKIPEEESTLLFAF